MFEKGQYIIYDIRGVYEVVDITTIDRPGRPQGKLYHIPRPYYRRDSKIVTPADPDKIAIRLLPTQGETPELIDRIQDMRKVKMTEDKQREEQYREILKTCDCRVWVGMIRALYLRREGRIEQGKKMTDLDEQYSKTTEENLYLELALPLGMSRDEMVDYIEGCMLAETPAVG